MAADAPSRIETLSVLFTDLVESTGRRVRSGEEAADRDRLRHDRAVREAIEAQGGSVAKHTGDGVMATFTGASEAIGAAVAIQQAIDVENRRAGGEPLRVRIGVSAGDVSVEGEDCFGLPVVEAQRLESAARPGHILISSIVKVLARGRGGHRFTAAGALELKGLEGPLDADEVHWDPVETVAVDAATPPALLSRAASPSPAALSSASSSTAPGSRPGTAPAAWPSWPGSPASARRGSPRSSRPGSGRPAGVSSPAAATNWSACPTSPSPRPSASSWDGPTAMSTWARCPRS